MATRRNLDNYLKNTEKAITQFCDCEAKVILNVKVKVMSETTYISEELVMEGTLDSAGSSVVVAGRFKGELRARDVLLEANSIFDGNLIADQVTLGGLVKGEVAANTLNVSSTARIEGNLKTNSLSIDLGAEVAGNISRIS